MVVVVGVVVLASARATPLRCCVTVDESMAPLAIPLPDSVDIGSDAAGFRGLEFDRTGLKHRPHHRWVVFTSMTPGVVGFFFV
jgi:hypothetical protein